MEVALTLAEKFRGHLGYPEKEEFLQQDDLPEDRQAAPQEQLSEGSIAILCPRAFEDASTVVDNLNQGKTIILNLEAISGEVVRRMMDFLGGAAYAKDARINRIAHSAYVITPYNVEFFSDVEEDGFFA